MSKWKWKRPDIIEMPDGRRYFFMASGHDFEAHLNAMQAVVDAADLLLAYQGNRGEGERSDTLREALAKLEAGNA